LTVLRKIIYVLTFIGIAVFLYFKWEELSSILRLNWIVVTLLLILALTALLFNSTYFHAAIKLFGVNLKVNESLGLTVLNTMYSYLMPAKTGIVFRAYYLKIKHNFPYQSNITFLIGNLIVSGMVSLVLSNIVSFTYWQSGELSDSLFYGLIILTIASFCILYLLDKVKFPRDQLKSRILIFIKSSITDVRTFKTNKRLLYYTILAQLLLLIISAIRLYVTFKVLGFDVDFLRVLTVQILLNFSLIISITPGNLGIKEGIIAFSAAFLSVSVDEALLVAIIDRAALMIIIFLLGIYYSHTLLTDIDASKK